MILPSHFICILQNWHNHAVSWATVTDNLGSITYSMGFCTFVHSKCFRQRYRTIRPCIYVQYISLHFPPASLFYSRRFLRICTNLERVVTINVFPFLFGSLLLTRCRFRGLLLHLITHVDTHTHTVGFPCVKNRAVVEKSTCTTHNTKDK